jgi:mannose-6-phosphate isomerase-like protein (cupin superfamily)
MAGFEVKNMSNPDEIRTLPKTKGEIINIGEYTLMRGTFEPGWKWSECIKPAVGTQSCEVKHVLYVISGRMALKMNDGSEKEFGPGDFGVIPPGHDAWVVGNENCVSIDFTAGKTYGKK